MNPIRVEKSSADCAEQNKNNALAIEQGLVAFVQPTDEIIRKEARQSALVERNNKRRQMSRKLFTAVMAKLGDLASIYDMKKTEDYMAQEQTTDVMFGDPSVTVEAYSGGNIWNSTFAYWRVVVGSGYSKRKYIKLSNTFEFPDNVVDKVVAAIQDRHNDLLQKEQANKARQTHEQNNKAAFEANKATFEILGLHYDFKICLQKDGRIGAETNLFLTPEQWAQVAALVKSFKS